MKALKKVKVNMWLNALMLILIGILLIVEPHESMGVITIAAGFSYSEAVFWIWYIMQIHG